MDDNSQKASGIRANLVTSEMIAPGAITQRHLDPGNSNAGDLYYGKDGVRFTELPIGTSGQVLTVASDVPAWVAPVSTDGWVTDSNTWTYGSASSPEFTITVSGIDLTGVIGLGDRIKLTQTTVKYFIVTKIAFSTNTTITVYGGTDYTLANATITSPYYSHAKTPFGFPIDTSKWTQETTDTTQRVQALPVVSTWYNLGSVSLAVPTGAWKVFYGVSIGASVSASGAPYNLFTTLSSANNSESDQKLSTHQGVYGNNGQETSGFSFKEGYLLLTATATYYLNSSTSSINVSNLYNNNDLTKAIIRAICAYL